MLISFRNHHRQRLSRICHSKHGGQGQGNCSALLCSAPVFFMGRIVTCKCALEFFDSTGETTCNRCRRNLAESRAKVDRLKSKYETEKANGTFCLQWEIIQCYWREGLTLSEMEKVFGLDEETIGFQIDIARQNAR